MLNSPKASSSQHVDHSEIRYQKALKEINKLISINNDLREELSQGEAFNTELKRALQEKEEQIGQLKQQNQRLRGEMKEALMKYESIQEQNEELLEQVNYIKNKTSIENELPLTRGAISNDIRGSNRPKQNVNQLKRIIDELENTIQRKNQIIKEITNKNEQLTSEKKGEKNQGTYYAAAEIDKNNVGEGDLGKQLRSANLYIQTLSQQCAGLKTALLKAQNSNNLLRVGSQNQLKKYRLFSPALTPRTGNEESKTQIHKRLRKLQHQNEKVNRKYEQSKQKLQKIKQSYQQQAAEKALNKQKLTKYEELIERQQSEIQELINDNEKTIQQMTQQFKEKLLEQRKYFNPMKNAKALKLAEGLQSQKKAWKKKFQIVSGELTKYVKVMDLYKAKLAEIQGEYNNLQKENEALMEKLGMNIEKSNYSKGSNRRLAAENDRLSQ